MFYQNNKRAAILQGIVKLVGNNNIVGAPKSSKINYFNFNYKKIWEQ